MASTGLDKESSPTYFYGEYKRRRPRALVRVAGRPEHEEWADSVQELVRVGSRGAYVNFHADDSEASLRDIYPGASWHRLVEVKKDYDPDNLFQSNHNIVPGDR